jgi:hypothetical protein
MLLARIEGNVVATRKHPSFEGWRLLICQPINPAGEPEGAPQVAIDAHGAGCISASSFLPTARRPGPPSETQKPGALDGHRHRG